MILNFAFFVTVKVLENMFLALYDSNFCDTYHAANKALKPRMMFYFSGVLEDIEEEFDMDKEWMGGLIQTAFTLFYVIGAPIFGFIGDRYSRKWLIILSIALWSTSTIVSSFMAEILR